jgi:peptidoglycan/LPS O-acetylase OafA/YrhL
MQPLVTKLSACADCGEQLPIAGASHRIPELDGIRGLAILMVLVWHYFSCLLGSVERGSGTFFIQRLCTLAWSGVDLFFVLSGCLIGGIMLDHAGKRGFAKNFLLRRLFRIAPAYAVLLTVFWLVNSSQVSSRNTWLLAGAMPFASYCAMVQNVFMAARQTFGCNALGITWSLAVEEQFYCFVILVFLLGRPRTAASSLLLLGVLAPVLRMLVPGFHAYVLLPFRMDAFSLGFAVALAIRSPSTQKWCRENSHSLYVCVCILLVGCGAATWRGGMGQLDHTFLAFFYAFVVLLAALNSGHLLMLPFRSRLLKAIGGYSYGIYLYHQFVLGVMHTVILGAAPSLVSSKAVAVRSLSLVLTFLLATASFHCLEFPFIKMSRKFSYGTPAE